MLIGSNKFYTREFKINAVRLFESSDKSMTQVARSLGIGSTSLHRWCQEFATDKKAATPKNNPVTTYEELNRLKLELEVLRQERDVLRKAVSILSRESC